MHHPKDPCAKPLLHQGGKKVEEEKWGEAWERKREGFKGEKSSFLLPSIFFFAAAKS